MGKNPEIYKNETKEKFPVLFPSHPPSTKWMPIVFRCSKTPKKGRTYRNESGKLHLTLSLMYIY